MFVNPGMAIVTCVCSARHREHDGEEAGAGAAVRPVRVQHGRLLPCPGRAPALQGAQGQAVPVQHPRGRAVRPRRRAGVQDRRFGVHQLHHHLHLVAQGEDAD